jgi:hypothetical protein
MFKSLLSSILAAAAVCFLSPVTSYAQRHSGGGAHPTNDTYIVIQVMNKVRNNDGKSDYQKEYKAIANKTLRDEVKRAKDDYEQAKKEWKDELKSDPKAPRPVQWTPKKVSGSPTFETLKGAQDYADKLKEEDEKKGDKNK